MSLKVNDKKKAILIAKDVLRRLRYLKVKANNVYCSTYGFEPIKGLPSSDKPDNLQKYLPQIEKQCNVCAIGSIFLSFVRLYNEVTTGVSRSCGISSMYMLPKLRTVFTNEQLDKIETAFECAYHEFGVKYSQDKERLRAIMLNIVKNNGEFKPEQV